VLRAAHPEDACWTFSDGHRTEAFWPRRQAHETWVHLVDLEQVLGRTSDIPASLAADGVDEVLDVFLPRMHSKGLPARLSAPLLLDATDTDDAWLLTPSESGDGPPLVERLRDDGPGRRGRHLTALGPLRDDAPDRVDAVRAAASDLMLLLWKRRSPDHRSIILDGDRSRLLAFLRSPLTP
jgi:hypothetical protein